MLSSPQASSSSRRPPRRSAATTSASFAGQRRRRRGRPRRASRRRSNASAASTSWSTTRRPTRTTASRSASTRRASTRRSRSTCAARCSGARRRGSRRSTDKPGVIINIASVGGLRAEGGLGVYNLTKAALIHLTRQLAGELGPTRVVGIAPGLVQTDFAGVLVENFGDELAARDADEAPRRAAGHRQPGHVPRLRPRQLDHRRDLRHRRRRRRVAQTPERDRRAPAGPLRSRLVPSGSGRRDRVTLGLSVPVAAARAVVVVPFPTAGPAGVRIAEPARAPRSRPRHGGSRSAASAHRVCAGCATAVVARRRRSRRRTASSGLTGRAWRPTRVLRRAAATGSRGRRGQVTAPARRRLEAAACRARCAGSSRPAQPARCQNAGSTALTVPRSSSRVGGLPASRHDHRRDPLAPLGVGAAGTTTSATPGWSPRTASTGSGQTFSPPVMIRSPRRPSTCSRPSSRHRAEVAGGSQPSASSGSRAVAVGPQQHRAAQADLAVGVDAHLDAVERAPVVDHAAAGLGHAVRRDDVGRPVGRRRRAAEHDRRGTRVGSMRAQGRGDERHVASRRRASTAAASKPSWHGQRRAGDAAPG